MVLIEISSRVRLRLLVGFMVVVRNIVIDDVDDVVDVDVDVVY